MAGQRKWEHHDEGFTVRFKPEYLLDRLSFTSMHPFEIPAKPVSRVCRVRQVQAQVQALHRSQLRVNGFFLNTYKVIPMPLIA